ncbi:26S proteasome non-ATPase regulatory subunit 8 homolog A-like [Lolium rigidum]|uniref:26S proteasome non-ATPase regulatory subunit 8 homolog A-like n=1 Tax=Lolium rigidum TaxID=89674 RepID=UPI001F5C72E7|nr:26S proteasome non-ATPase regulatory subunit 8 homolog A-like [Lolium rigidum]
MDGELDEAIRKLAWLNFDCSRNELGSCVARLSELKILLTKFPSLPPTFEMTPNAVEELKFARAVYEFAVILSMEMKDQEAFERDLVQLKGFYMDTRGMIPPSPDEYPILGLNLMRLLAGNRIAEFHTELELLPLGALHHPCIKYAVELEQAFMEGTYRLINDRKAVPHESYRYFMDLLAETIRDEIADCSGQAYDHLPVNDAMEMLMFSSDQQLLEYISEKQHEWEVQNHSVHFHMAKPQPRVGVHSFKLIKQSLCYALELEQVV